jgi:ParB family chromosome partitioning protein
VPTLAKRRSTLADYEVATETTPAVDDRIVHKLPVADIRPNPHNPRQHLNGIDELAASMSEHELMQPVVVRRRGRSGYELIAGHRRLEAAKSLDWTEINAVVRHVTPAEAEVLAIVENLQREDLTAKEEAKALEVLMRRRGWTTRQVGEAIKRSHIYVSRRLRVFEDEVLAGPVLADELPVSTAEELLRADPEARPQLAERAIAENWGQADARRAVASWNVTFQSGQPSPRLASRIRALRDELAGLDLAALPARTRRELARLVELVNS